MLLAAPSKGQTATQAATTDAVPVFAARHYTDPARLVAAVCADAQSLFDNFFAPQRVTVYPFIFVDQEGNKHLTTLGLTLADGMIGAINNAHLDPVRQGATPQELRGVLQEIGTSVRVHMKGINAEGRHRSYVATIELSPAVYRILHETVASAWRLPDPPAP